MLVSVISVVVVLNVLTIIRTLADELALQSAESVARDTSSMITLTAAAPGEITIKYQPSNKYSYDLSVKDHLVNVNLLSPEGGSCQQAFGFAVDQRICSGTGKAAIDVLAVPKTGNLFTFSKVKDA